MQHLQLQGTQFKAEHLSHPGLVNSWNHLEIALQTSKHFRVISQIKNSSGNKKQLLQPYVFCIIPLIPQ